jgi:type I restriction enzyme, S subunit
MITDQKPYKEYKESGIPWLGKIPKHWKLERTKWHFSNNKDINSDYLDNNILSLTLRGVVNNDPNNPEGLVPKDYGTYQIFEKHDLVFKLIDLENLRTSRVGLVHEDGIMSSAYIRLAPFNRDGVRFFYHQFYDLYQRGIFNQLGAGVRSTLGSSDLLNLPIVVPDSNEQLMIVQFLEYASRRFARAIRLKKKLIALLNEQKQIVIHRAVTRGLNPDAPLKPSGIPWLGDIPADWGIRQLKRVVSFITSGSRSWANFYSDDGLIFIQSGNLGRSMALNFSYTQHVRPPSGAEGERTRIQRDDVLICITGALTGNVVHVDQELPGPSFVNQHVALVRPRTQAIRPRFLAYALHSEVGRSQFKTSEYGGTKQGLGLGDVKSVFVSVPSLKSQDDIVVHLDTTLANYDEAIASTEREIALIQEYRTQFTADIVTGKLDVREAAVKLAEETEEPEMVDEDMRLAEDDIDEEDLEYAVNEEAEA